MVYFQLYSKRTSKTQATINYRCWRLERCTGICTTPTDSEWYPTKTGGHYQEFNINDCLNAHPGQVKCQTKQLTCPGKLQRQVSCKFKIAFNFCLNLEEPQLCNIQFQQVWEQGQENTFHWFCDVGLDIVSDFRYSYGVIWHKCCLILKGCTAIEYITINVAGL